MTRIALGRGCAWTAALAALVAVFGLSSTALAVEHHPKGDFAPFADCPLSTTGLEECIVAETTSGKFIVGNETVPISKTITLQGGDFENEVTGLLQFVGAEDGKTLSKTPLNVPGGLLNLVKCNEISNFFERAACEVIFENGLTGVTATTELAAPASTIGLSVSNLINDEGTALALPVKVKLSNPLLGENCYIGSNAKPIVLELTTGTTAPPLPNKPITGATGTIVFSHEGQLLVDTGNSLVNNTFAAPKSEGCGGIFSFLIDPIVDSKLGLPAASGRNTAILEGTLKQATATAVKASE